MRIALLAFCALLLASACKISGPSLSGKRSPHEQYSETLEKAGLKNTALGAAWFNAAEKSLSNPINTNLPFLETGYFPAETPSAIGLRLKLRRGERLEVKLDKKPVTGFRVYMELWKEANEKPELVKTADTAAPGFIYDAKGDGSFILRVQPELLSGGEYTLTVRNGPSLAFPVQTTRPAISSYWGDPRDGGARKHEGVDIFAKKGTPLLAAAGGTITRVEETNVGGKVVWLRPDDADYTLYYAHLDEQRVTRGQRVRAGEIVGTSGNTGNARTTGAHLHFGIYAQDGAIDPLVFIQPSQDVLPVIKGNKKLINQVARSGAAMKLYPLPDEKTSATRIEKHVPFRIESAQGAWYRIKMPEGVAGYIQVNNVQELTPLKKIRIEVDQPLLDFPSVEAAKKDRIAKGEVVELFGVSGKFGYVKYKNTFGWTLV